MASVLLAGQSVELITLPLIIFRPIQLVVRATLARCYVDTTNYPQRGGTGVSAMTASPTSTPASIDPVGAGFAIGLPLLAGAATLVLAASWQDRLPVPLATHWSLGPEPDGFSRLWSHTWFMVAMIILVGGGSAVAAAFAAVHLMLRRILLIVGLTVTGMMFTINTVLMASQRGLQDASGVPLASWSIGLGVLIGLLAGLAGAGMLQDLRPRVRAASRPGADLPRAANPRLPVTFTIGLASQWLWLICGGTSAGAVIACLAAGSLWPLPLFAPLLLLVFGVSRYRVEADEKGVRVRTIGTVMLAYDLDEIAGACVIDVNPFWDFGGWGMRFTGGGRYGIVTAKGPAAQITMASGDTVTITTSRAEELAGAINTLADTR